jgi:predicted nucleotidyltransferase
MHSLGETIRKLREEKELPLRTVAAFLDIDQAILSKIERGLRKPNRELVIKLSEYFQVPEKELLLAWLADKVLYEVGDEEMALEALQMAEERAAYLAFQKIDRDEVLKKIQNGIAKFKEVEKAWIYGSFARKEDGPKSDVDIAVQADSTFSYFDLVEIQHELEKIIHRKVDVGFIDSFKPYIFEHVKEDLKLIYER